MAVILSESEESEDVFQVFRCLYGKGISMRTIQRLFVLLAVLAVSCSKQEVSYDGTRWAGDYELEDQTACIELFFQDDAKVCRFWSGLVGLISANLTIYDVNWSSGNSFSLSRSAGGQTIVSYAGEIYGDRMFLYFLSCDKVERTVVLQRYKFELL